MKLSTELVLVSAAAVAFAVTLGAVAHRNHVKHAAQRAITTESSERELIVVEGNHVHVFHDDARDTTCYVFVNSISCVKDKDGANR